MFGPRPPLIVVIRSGDSILVQRDLPANCCKPNTFAAAKRQKSSLYSLLSTLSLSLFPSGCAVIKVLTSRLDTDKTTSLLLVLGGRGVTGHNVSMFIFYNNNKFAYSVKLDLSLFHSLKLKIKIL